MMAGAMGRADRAGARSPADIPEAEHRDTEDKPPVPFCPGGSASNSLYMGCLRKEAARYFFAKKSKKR